MPKMKLTLDGLWQEFKDFLSVRKERSMSLGQIMSQVSDQLYPMWINDVYRDSDGTLYITLVDSGKLYRAAIDFDGDGNPAAGDLVEVEVMHQPKSSSQERNFTVKRQKDGTYRWFEISATSVLNKAGEIDSTDLFDSFVDYIDRTQKYPYRTFHHQGKMFEMGQYDFIARDGFVLIGSGVYHDNELAKLDIKARKKNPGKWGQSINFVPVGDPELWDVGDGIEIPVYRAGILEEISSLLSEDASAHYTNRADVRQEVNRMLKGRQLKAFAEYFDGDEDEAKEWLEANVDRTNADITDANQITRAEDEVEVEDELEDDEVESEDVEDESAETDEEETDDEVDEAVEDETVDDAQEIVADESMITAVAEQVLASDFVQNLQASVNEVLDALSSLTDDVGQLQAASVGRGKKFEKRLEALETNEEEKKREWHEDIPRRSRVKVTHRPRATEDEEDGEPDFEAIAEATLAGLE